MFYLDLVTKLSEIKLVIVSVLVFLCKFKFNSDFLVELFNILLCFIPFQVTPVDEKSEKEKSEDLECESSTKQDEDNEDVRPKEDGKRVSFNLPLESESSQQVIIF